MFLLPNFISFPPNRVSQCAMWRYGLPTLGQVAIEAHLSCHGSPLNPPLQVPVTHTMVVGANTRVAIELMLPHSVETAKTLKSVYACVDPRQFVSRHQPWCCGGGGSATSSNRHANFGCGNPRFFVRGGAGLEEEPPREDSPSEPNHAPSSTLGSSVRSHRRREFSAKRSLLVSASRGKT